MHEPKVEGTLVFRTPWFQVYSKELPDAEPHYSIAAPDFVCIVGVNNRGRLLMVRQFRPAVGAVTLELPAGHVEEGETPEQAARKELLEETGYTADRLELLAVLSPSAARFTNRQWCYFSDTLRAQTGAPVEHGMEPLFYEQGLQALLKEPDFYSAGNCAALFAALAKGRIRL